MPVPSRFSTPGALLVSGALTAASLVILAVWCRFPVPYRDDWDWLVWTVSGPISPGRLFQPHNEHLIPLPRLLFWLQYRLEGAAGQLLFWVTLALHFTLVWAVLREIRYRWPVAAGARHAAAGLTLTILCHSWQLQSLVFVAAFLFPLVQCLAVLGIAAAVRAAVGGPVRGWWMAAAHAASLAAMLSTTNGLAVPVTLALLSYAARESRAAIAAHVMMAIVGGAVFYALALAPTLGAAPGGTLAGSSGAMLGYFAAFFVPFVTYSSVPAGVAAGTLAALPGLAFISWIVVGRRSVPRLELFAAGLMLFAFGSAVLAAVGRASLGITQAAQSRYATYALVYWVALILAGMSLVTRSSPDSAVRRWSGWTRRIALPAVAVLMATHAIAGLVWIAKAANVTAAGLAVRADVPDEAWLRTLHPNTQVIRAAMGPIGNDPRRTPVDEVAGTTHAVDARLPGCGGTLALSLIDNPSGPTLRLDGQARTDATRGIVVDVTQRVIGLAIPAPLVAIPEPTRDQVVAAVQEALIGTASGDDRRWFGLARHTGESRYALILLSGDGRPLCATALTAPVARDF